MHLKLFLISFVVLTGLTHQSVSAQCIAEAGPDTILCETDFGYYVVGGSPTASQGQPPYSYRWYTKEKLGIYVPASDFLSDTTVANPTLNQPGMTLYIEVNDANGSKCLDSFSYSASYFEFDLIVKKSVINKGDSVRLRTSIHGGWQPFQFSWSPKEHLTDYKDSRPYAFPWRTTLFDLEITDSMGCKAYDNYMVEVSGNSSVPPKLKYSIVVNGTDDALYLQQGNEKYYKITIHDINAREIMSINCRGAVGPIKVDIGHLVRGIYLINVETSSGQKLSSVMIH